MSDGALLSFEDFPPGRVLEFGAYPVTKEEIVDFATAFDPQAFHLDEKAAQRSMLGGLSASGWHTCAILMRLNCDGFLNMTDGRGAPGIDEVKWLKPVRPGMILSVRAEVLAARVSQSRPSIGLAQFRFDVRDQDGVVVMTQTNFVMIGRRGHESAPRGAPKADATVAPLPVETPDDMPLYSKIEIGKRIVLGTRSFPEEDVLAFAQLFDPQPFHTDHAAARNGPFGALAASGWHTAASWMRALIDAKKRAADAMTARGEKAPETGPSPGFVKLRWLKPVYAGDSVTFDTIALDKRVTSRPGWGLVRSKNSGANQHGERVLEFESSAFWKLD
ncbi:MAG: dehydratase [Hyphomicrobiales bacterium]|nr:dehydratase [Hyphomicrobiales bacterium]